MATRPQLPHLPITENLDDVRQALRDGTTAVISAPPGAGKTTLVPLSLLDEPWLGARRIVMLEPRRLATRAAAQRMAALSGTPVGGLVGYQTRDERWIGRGTRVEVLTEGILTRRLQHDPELPGVGAVIFDEVHERNLPTELGLALVLEAAATLRPDLRIVAMSATADTAAFAALLGRAAPDDADAPAPVIHSEGRMFDVDIRWVHRDRGRGGRAVRIEDLTASTVRRALETDPGDVLVFLPGIGEIERVAHHLGDVCHGIDVHRLAGSIAPSEQDAALRPSPAGRRKVVLATDIAETSLTVEGVRVVVDSGLARQPRFDAGTGMTRLTTVSISRDSAEQRSGRAGRTEPGVAYRLWTRIEHGTRNARRQPELASVDLAGFVLELAAFGASAGELAFIDQPPQRAMQTATELLTMLGALDAAGRITGEGLAMSTLPVHPRLARILTAAPSSLACAVAALVDDRDIFRGRPSDLPADIALRIEALDGRGDERADRRSVARLRDRAEDLARRLGIVFDVAHLHVDLIGPTLLAGFPDRLGGRRRHGQFQLRGGHGVFVADDDPLAGSSFIVAAELDGNRSGARVRLGADVRADDIGAVLDDVVTDAQLVWDAERDDLVVRVHRRLDSLSLDTEVRRAEPGPATQAALVDRVRDTALGALTWTERARNLQARVALLRDTLGDGWPVLHDASLVADVDSWLGPALAGATGRDDLAAIDVAGLLRGRLPWPESARLDQLAPVEWIWPGGRRSPIDYTAQRPTVSVRVQDVFGTKSHPTIVDGRVALTVALLSPADRPIQVTADLPGFWAGTWADVRKELRGRYPKHRWPTDPAGEAPGRARPR